MTAAARPDRRPASRRGRGMLVGTTQMESGLTSVIVPCWNQLEFTRECLRALFRHTTPAWELIVVDNGSTDGTGEFLAGIQAGGRVPVTVIHNARNRGFPAAINQGLRAARGEYLVLLNNDAVVTEGWLDHLIALSAAIVDTTDEAGRENDEELLNTKDTKDTKGGTGGSNKEDESIGRGQSRGKAMIGLVGPMSNYASPPQLVENVPYRDLDEMHAFAAGWQAEHRGRWFTVAKLSGFCLLMTRAVYDAIGGLDERFGLGLFDDDDLAERARRAGFELAVAHDLFIHHFGSRTFAGNGIDAGRLLEENARKFAGKWGRDVPEGRRVALSPWGARTVAVGEDRRFRIQDSSTNSTTAITANRREEDSRFQIQDSREWEITEKTGPSAGRVRTSLTMIVRDAEKDLPKCLESARGVFDEIVVVDTGSVDRTAEIAREYGARVFDFVWVDDFAAARNAALARARGDYAFWLDADDVIEPPEREKLVALLRGLGSPEMPARVNNWCQGNRSITI